MRSRSSACWARPIPRGIELAARDGVPFLLLDEHAPGARTTAFQLIHAPESRAIALAQRALALGARRFVVLGPDSASGKRLAGAFKNALAAGGGTLVAHITYRRERHVVLRASQ